MNQCVPGWDVSRQGREPELAGGLPQIAFAVSKSKSSDQQQLCGPNEMADYVPDYNEVAELTWVNGHLAMQGLGSKAHNRHHHRSSGLACHWTDADHTCAAAARSQENEKEVDGTLDAIVLHEATRYNTDSVGNLPPLDDDTVSWFPLNYFSEHEAGLSRKAVNEELKSTKNTVRSTAETAQVDAANPANVESFDALVPSNINTDRCNNYLVNHSNAPKGNCAEVDEHEVPTPATIAARDNVNGSMNFSHFSRPAVMIKANLHTLGIASGPTNVQRVRQRYRNMNEYHHQQRQDAGNVSGSDANVPASIVGSTNGLSTNSISSEEISRSTSLHIANKTSRSLPSAVTSDDCLTKALHQDQSRNYGMSGSAGTIGREIASETCDALDITFASTSGGTPTNSTEKSGKETSWKRKSRTEEDSGCQSEDMEDESAQPVKKSQSGRSSSTKRSRAAAVHNQSERRRRDRINERMKALQKLIPNSNKTDKASMLDEAIEYLKQLQAQLQIMSIRNGLNLPAAMMPLGMQPLQMSLLAPLAPMGLGIGMSGVGLGMGMGMMDMNSIAAGGCGMVPIHGTGAHALQPATFIQPNLAAFSTTSDGNDRMQSSVMLDPYTAFMAGQRQSMNMDLYNTMALHQQQLHQHQKHCLSQQQDNNSGKSNQ